ncbi:MAG: T9SS type A sorting domain-containing protein, partial [Candidatus Eisenbacteria bacterium]
LPSVDGRIDSVVRYGTDIVVAGDFQSIGGIAANNLARWDGAAWHALGDGIDGSITCLTVFGNDLYAGGQFQFVNGVFAPNLAKWDGESWSPFGILSHSYLCCYEVNSLVVYRGELLAGGTFSPSVSGVQGLARWNGSLWVPFAGDVAGPVGCMLAVGDTLYVAGRFDSAGGVPASNVALWDGDSWSPLGPGLGVPSQQWGVQSMVSLNGKLYAAGYFEYASGATPTTFAAWDGASWASMEFVGGGVSGLALDGNAIAMVSYGGVVRWDGETAPRSLPGLFGYPAALLADAGGLLAIGGMLAGTSDLSTISGLTIARWTGQSWQAVEPWNPLMNGLATYWGTPANVECLAVYEGELIAGGGIDLAGDGAGWRLVGGLSRWNRTSWSSMTPGLPSGARRFMALHVEGDTLYAGGEFSEYNGTGPSGYTRRPVWRWDSNHWSPLDTLSVAASWVTRYDGHITIGTAGGWSDQRTLAGVYALRGGTWEVLGLAGGSYAYLGIECSTLHQGKLVIGGPFTSIDGVAADGIAAWNGHDWESIGDMGLSPFRVPTVYALASNAGRLYAAGQFWLNGVQVPVVVWDGVAWRAVSGLSGWPEGLAVIRGRVFVGGRLHIQSYPGLVSVAMLDGDKWEPLGSGVNGSAREFVEYDGALHVAGNFSFAGGKSAFSIAKWQGFLPPKTPRSPWLSGGRPNPSLAGSDFSFRIQEGAAVRIAVYDARGREVALLDDGYRVAGTHAVRWNGRDRGGRMTPAGVYFVTVRTGSGSVTSRKIVRLR